MHIAKQGRFFAGLKPNDFSHDWLARYQRHHGTGLEPILSTAQNLQAPPIFGRAVNEGNIVMWRRSFERGCHLRRRLDRAGQFSRRVSHTGIWDITRRGE